MLMRDFAAELNRLLDAGNTEAAAALMRAGCAEAGGEEPATARPAGAAEPDESLFDESIDRLGALVALPPATVLSLPTLGPDDAHWPADPKNAPDTWHLPPETATASFTFNAALVDRLIAAGAYEPDLSTNGRLILSLRGCVLAGGEAYVEDAESVSLRASRPDHENFRCLIGVFDSASGRISLYTASTVPRRTGMLKFYNKMNFGGAGPNCNMLPTGLYQLCVGTHGGSGGPVSYVLRLGTGPTAVDASPAVVLRTSNDLTYGTRDIWDHCIPADNIHPAFLGASFSSLGCLTVRGTQAQNGDYASGSGEWRRFRIKAGFDGSHYGHRFDNLLTTGHEAATLAGAGDVSAYLCLRHGSRGARVASLQSQLGLTADASLGPATREALARRQMQQLGLATASWSRAMAELMGMAF